MLRIIIGGDICPMGRIQNEFIEGNAERIFHDLMEEIVGADLSVVNLECPLISHETPIDKPGTILGANNKCIQGFVATKWDVLNLANNHSFDHGARGLQETIHTIKQAGPCVVGAGGNIKEAQTPLVKEINGKRIVIYSMAEREFSIADEKTPGANPLDLISFVNAIRHHKQQGIFIALIHGGKEFYPYPSPEMVRRCRFMVDMGADAVICCHTHCPLPWEIYADRPIVYGLGNLIFEPLHVPLSSWYEGYLAKLTIENGSVQFEAIPYYQSKGISGVQKMDVSERKIITTSLDLLKTIKCILEKLGFKLFNRSVLFYKIDLNVVCKGLEVASPADILAKEDIQKDRDYYNSWFTKDEALARLKKGYLLFGTSENDKIVCSEWVDFKEVKIAYLGLKFNIPENVAYITGRFTVPALRGKGLASQMEKGTLGYLKKKAYTLAICVTDPVNIIAVNLNKKLKWESYQIVNYRRYWFIKCYSVTNCKSNQKKVFITLFRAPEIIWKVFL